MSVLEEQAAHHSSSVTFNISLTLTDRLSRNGNLLNLWNPPPSDWQCVRSCEICCTLIQTQVYHQEVGFTQRRLCCSGFVALRCPSEGRKYGVALKMCKFAKMVSRGDFSFPLAGSNQVKVKWRFEKRRKLQHHTRQRKCVLLRTAGAVHCGWCSGFCYFGVMRYSMEFATTFIGMWST